MDPKIAKKLLQAIQEGKTSGLIEIETESEIPEEIRTRPLELMVTDYNIKHTFRRGERVRWKKGWKVANYPTYDQEAIVLEIFPDAKPVNDPSKTESGVYNYIYDIRLAMKMPDGSVACFCFDSRHFEPVDMGKPN